MRRPPIVRFTPDSPARPVLSGVLALLLAGLGWGFIALTGPTGAIALALILCCANSHKRPG